MYSEEDLNLFEAMHGTTCYAFCRKIGVMRNICEAMPKGDEKTQLTNQIETLEDAFFMLLVKAIGYFMTQVELRQEKKRDFSQEITATTLNFSTNEQARLFVSGVRSEIINGKTTYRDIIQALLQLDFNRDMPNVEIGDLETRLKNLIVSKKPEKEVEASEEKASTSPKARSNPEDKFKVPKNILAFIENEKVFLQNEEMTLKNKINRSIADLSLENLEKLAKLSLPNETGILTESTFQADNKKYEDDVTAFKKNLTEFNETLENYKTKTDYKEIFNHDRELHGLFDMEADFQRNTPSEGALEKIKLDLNKNTNKNNNNEYGDLINFMDGISNLAPIFENHTKNCVLLMQGTSGETQVLASEIAPEKITPLMLTLAPAIIHFQTFLGQLQSRVEVLGNSKLDVTELLDAYKQLSVFLILSARRLPTILLKLKDFQKASHLSDSEASEETADSIADFLETTKQHLHVLQDVEKYASLKQHLNHILNHLTTLEAQLNSEKSSPTATVNATSKWLHNLFAKEGEKKRPKEEVKRQKITVLKETFENKLKALNNVEDPDPTHGLITKFIDDVKSDKDKITEKDWEKLIGGQESRVKWTLDHILPVDPAARKLVYLKSLLLEANLSDMPFKQKLLTNIELLLTHDRANLYETQLLNLLARKGQKQDSLLALAFLATTDLTKETLTPETAPEFPTKLTDLGWPGLDSKPEDDDKIEKKDNIQQEIETIHDTVFAMRKKYPQPDPKDLNAKLPTPTAPQPPSL